MRSGTPISNCRRTLAAVLLAVLLLAPAGPAARAAETAAPPPAGEGTQAVREMIDLILQEYRGQVDEDDLIRGAIRGVLDSLGDPYSYYMDPQEFAQFNQDLNGAFGGIGVVIESRDGLITVVSVLPGTPSEQAGLQPGDRLVAVDGRSIRGSSVGEAVRLIRGEPGTLVRLTVDRQGTTIELTLSRSLVEIPAIDTHYREDRVAYIKLTQFNAGVADKFQFVYDRYVSMNVRGVILDLRNNPGGYLDEAVGVARILVPKGPIVHIVDRDGRKMTVNAIPHAPGPPLVVLVNGGSASASEIVAGAVRDNGAGVLVGTRTFGKGSVQTLFELPSQGGVRLTTARYLTPKGESIDHKGIDPDVVVEEANPSYKGPDFAPLGGRPLRTGLVGLDVLGVQQRLNFLGYKSGVEDGILGGRTAAALRAFQRDAGVQEAGLTLAGTATFTALETAVQSRIAARRQSAEDLVLSKAVEVANQMAAGMPPAAAGQR